ncbi:recombinase family protein [Mycolicibacter virginiensis]|uniref:recombinase family protein n=1 Tax=Mycolicibacter virginiensis TaxID=1795032 RepID=UPI001F034367|nr:recombinase family protein [Mycolicibacter virginiensis]ULP48915.1 recombinase family protein [Mycolicibacter virginiensis]
MSRRLRAVVGSRVSHLDDDKASTRKVSHLAQTEEGERWAQSHGYTVVGTFEDLGISAGKTTPFERPDLGKWLAPERLHEWDVLVFAKIDRAFRSTADCVDFAKWTKENKKILAFAGDGVVLDYLHPAGDSLDQMMSEFFIYVGSFFAAIELSRFKTRATDRLDYLRMTDRVSHGVPPLGYRTVKHSSGQGKALARDPEGYKLLHEIRNKLVDERQSLTSIARWLNEQGKTTNVARSRGGGKWSVATLKRVLTSQRTQGLRVMAVYEPAPTEKNPDNKKRVGEKLVLDPQGQPIRMAEPTFTDDDWALIQAAVGRRTASGKARQMTPNPLAGIGFCQCGYALALHRRRSSSGKLHTYVRCGRALNGCRGAITLQMAEAILEEDFLDAHGDREMQQQVFVPGADHSQELAQTEQSLERLRWESDNGLVDDEVLYRSRLSSLVARKAELTANTVTPARWESVGTGKTFRELWADEATDRRQVLRDSGVRLVLHFPPRGTTTQTKVIPWELCHPEDWPEPELTAEQQAIRDGLEKLDVGEGLDVRDGVVRVVPARGKR